MLAMALLKGHALVADIDLSVVCSVVISQKLNEESNAGGDLKKTLFDQYLALYR